VYFTCSSLLKGAEQYFHQLSVFLLLVSLATFYLACQHFYWPVLSYANVNV